MKNQTAKTQRILFLILIMALAVDLAGRRERHSELQTMDMASKAELDCAARIKQGLTSEAKEANCPLEYPGILVNATISEKTRSDLEWDTPTNLPTQQG